jgi:hypothetical protein
MYILIPPYLISQFIVHIIHGKKKKILSTVEVAKGSSGTDLRSNTICLLYIFVLTCITQRLIAYGRWLIYVLEKSLG